jgi:predicted small metal-binding protein
MALQFQCKNVGVTDCKHTASADTADELLEKVAEHAETEHGVTLNSTLVNYALSTVEEV